MRLELSAEVDACTAHARSGGLDPVRHLWLTENGRLTALAAWLALRPSGLHNQRLRAIALRHLCRRRGVYSRRVLCGSRALLGGLASCKIG